MERRVNTKVSCTVWSRGKSGDHIKALPIAIAPRRGGVLSNRDVRVLVGD